MKRRADLDVGGFRLDGNDLVVGVFDHGDVARVRGQHRLLPHHLLLKENKMKKKQCLSCDPFFLPVDSFAKTLLIIPLQWFGCDPFSLGDIYLLPSATSIPTLPWLPQMRQDLVDGTYSTALMMWILRELNSIPSPSLLFTTWRFSNNQHPGSFLYLSVIWGGEGCRERESGYRFNSEFYGVIPANLTALYFWFERLLKDLVEHRFHTILWQPPPYESE